MMHVKHDVNVTSSTLNLIILLVSISQDQIMQLIGTFKNVNDFPETRNLRKKFVGTLSSLFRDTLIANHCMCLQHVD